MTLWYIIETSKTLQKTDQSVLCCQALNALLYLKIDFATFWFGGRAPNGEHEESTKLYSTQRAKILQLPKLRIRSKLSSEKYFSGTVLNEIKRSAIFALLCVKSLSVLTSKL